MIAIAAHRLMLFLRLALVAALAGYMLPTVSYAMHGDVAASYGSPAMTTDEHASHSHGGMIMYPDSMAMDHDGSDSTASHHKDTSKQECCSSFCLNMAVVCDSPQFRAIKASATLDYTNDELVFAAPIGLHRPPAFRT